MAKTFVFDHLYMVGVLKRVHDGNYGNEPTRSYQIHTSEEGMYRVPPGGQLNRSWTFHFLDPYHKSVAQPNLAHLKVEHRQLSLLVGST